MKPKDQPMAASETQEVQVKTYEGQILLYQPGARSDVRLTVEDRATVGDPDASLWLTLDEHRQLVQQLQQMLARREDVAVKIAGLRLTEAHHAIVQDPAPDEPTHQAQPFGEGFRAGLRAGLRLVRDTLHKHNTIDFSWLPLVRVLQIVRDLEDRAGAPNKLLLQRLKDGAL